MPVIVSVLRSLRRQMLRKSSMEAKRIPPPS
jgi:hypothetical protein